MRGVTVPFTLASMGVPNEESPPGYQLVKKIGKGAFGQCWLAKHILTDCPVAIKVIPRTENMQLLEREVSIWKDLDHPHIVQLYEVLPLHDSIYLATECGGEGELFSLLEKHPNGLLEEQAISIFTQVCSAVGYLHDLNIAHRDIKLENIFMTDNGKAKLGDFGFAIRTANEKFSEEWLGSAEYSAPEVLKNEPYDPKKADSWSLGVVLFALLTGYLPFSKVEDDCALISDLEKKVRIRVINQELCIPDTIPSPIKEIFHGLFTYDPGRRWSVCRVLEHNVIRPFIHQPAPEKGPPYSLSCIKVSDLPGIAERQSNISQNPDAAYALCKIIAGNAGRFIWADVSNRSTFSSPELPATDQRPEGGGKTWYSKLFSTPWNNSYLNVGEQSKNVSSSSLSGSS
jgi:serine/threonine protein kinase